MASAVTLAAVVLLTFLTLRLLPADPAAYLASGPGMGPEAIAALRAHLGLDQTLTVQFWRYAGGILRGDWGTSYTTGQSVLSDLLQRLPASLELAVTGGGLALLAGVPLGCAAAVRPGSAFDRLCRGLVAAGGALPSFVIGLLLIAAFYVRLGWTPEPVGEIDPLLVPPPGRSGFLILDCLLAGDGAAFLSALAHLILPSLSMAVFALAPITRITRSAMIAVLASDAILTARALGLPPHTVWRCYALPNALLPVMTAAGMIFSYLFSANVVVETVFAWPGIGAYALNATLAADYAPVQGFVLAVAGLFTVINLLIEGLYGLIDPRLRQQP